MAAQLQIARTDGVGSIEEKIAVLTAQLNPPKTHCLQATLASERRGTFFKDVWASMAVATGCDAASATEIRAWGLQDWSSLRDVDRFALSHPSLIGMQRGASILTDRKPRQTLDADAVRRAVADMRGVLGVEGARQRVVVEFDPQAPRAQVLSRGADARPVFFDFMRETLHVLEIGGRSSIHSAANAPRTLIIEWLYELYTNGFEHAQRNDSVRLFRVQKHQYPDRTQALKHADGMPELTAYLKTQPERPTVNNFNIVEASVSDFGPGIVDGFLQSPAGRSHQKRPREELLRSLVNEQLSCKSNDPSAGLGLRNALDAARGLDAFVSLRTAEFSLTMQGQSNPDTQFSCRTETLTPVVGTHWQLLLPDRSGQT